MTDKPSKSKPSKRRFGRPIEKLEAEYIPSLHHCITLIDFIPTTKRKKFDRWYDSLFPTSPRILWLHTQNPFEESTLGLFGGGFLRQVGLPIVNTDQDVDPYDFLVRPLPEPFHSLWISGGQLVDFTYFLAYSFFLKSEFEGYLSLDAFLKTWQYIPFTETLPDGTPVEGEKLVFPFTCPKLGSYRQSAIQTLKELGCVGLFLSQAPISGIHHVPSVNIFSLERIDFHNYEVWRKRHHSFFNFIDVSSLGSKVEDSLLCYQGTGFLGDKTISQGLALLISEKDLPNTDKALRSAVESMRDFLTVNLVPLFMRTYWPIFQMKITCEEYFRKIRRLERFDLERPDAVEKLPKHSQQIAKVHHNFVEYRLSEEPALDTLEKLEIPMRIGLKRADYNPLRPLQKGPEVDIVKGQYITGNRLIDKLRVILDRIQRRFESLSQLYQMVAMLRLTEASKALEEQQLSLTEQEAKRTEVEQLRAAQEARSQRAFNLLSVALGVLIGFEVLGTYLSWKLNPPNVLGDLIWIGFLVVLGVCIVGIGWKVRSLKDSDNVSPISPEH